jgi:creatinine amidohydrolase/Fe(II)-dependent formamide hydrolase-like protein
MTSSFLAACLLAAATAAATAAAGAAAPPAASVHLELMTSRELRERVAAGTRTVLLPIGGTEQNGPHLALGKHNLRVRALAERIALALHDTIVAPVLAYVPEGEIDPPSGHMRHAGTISIPSAAFEALLDAAARSLCRHGLHDVVLLGDHGGYQASLKRVAARFDKSRGSCRVHAPAAYYDESTTGQARRLRELGFAASEIGRHAGLADTSLALALTPALVRTEALADAGRAPGVDGDPRRATSALGEPGAERVVAATVAALKPLLDRKADSR